jgi:O-antigen/teichoic acid export membrane protein
MAQGVAHRILANTTFNALAFVWSNGIWLFLVPYILSGLGKEAYGVWALAGIVVGYVGLLDVGINRSFVKHIAESHALDDAARVNRIVNTGILFYALFSIPIVAVAYPLSGHLMAVLGVPESLLPEAIFVFRCSIVTFLGSTITGVIPGIQQAVQRFDISSKIRGLRSVVNALGCVIAIEGGFGLKGLALNSLAVFGLFAIVNVAIAYRLLPSLSLKPWRWFSGPLLRELAAFGTRLQISRVADLLVFQADKLIIGHFLGVASVATYQLGSAVVARVRSALTLAFPALLPAASELKATEQQSRLSELYVRASRYVGLVSIPLVGFVVLEAPLIVQTWLGPDYVATAPVVRILGFGYLVNLIAGVGVTISLACNRPELQMRAALISTVANLGLNLILVGPYGYLGVAAATSTALILGPAYFFYALHRDLAIRLSSFVWATYLKPVAFSVLCAVLVAAANARFGPGLEGLNRPMGVLVLAIHGLVFAAVYGLLVYKGRLLDDYDRELLGRYLRTGQRPDPHSGDKAC